ncbi:SAVED domain-containing protein [Tahibacter soli]|uniref:SAVED domain-containing protein n=1 Tax=Tahibacter soli TaxID=2983605 RepID=A0A9X3YJP2_9GAMM|nr:SAVED domain-containing protein [Tahibacter soli]MDC8012799.1 SAVED domain-containing protein [Tahibacter soli]
MAHPRLLILHGISSIRATGEAEVAAALTDDERRLPQMTLRLDTRTHENSIASGYWGPIDAQVRAFASEVLANLEEHGPAALLYVGIDEVPTLLALSAFLSDEHRLACRDYDRDQEVFHWPDKEGALAFESIGVPAEALDVPGDVVLRIELSYPVQSRDVHAAVPDRLADITIRPKGALPRPGLVRAQTDVEAFRIEVRRVLAEIEKVRPSTRTIHLFLAGPVSACLAAGQELRLRNGRRVQTYRYRAKDSPPQTPAILLTPEATAYVQAPLSDDELSIARSARDIWSQALTDINDHARKLRADGAWPSYLVPALKDARPCPTELASIWELVNERHSIASDDATEFRFDRDSRRWYLPDRMLVAMYQAANGDASTVQRLARAFLWHEYLHEYQNLTENTATGIGSFPNCLERLDYIADAYGTLHQVDFILRQGNASDEQNVLEMFRDAITEAIDAFWTFEGPPPNRFWQTRRLRRYLNWYWRREQIIHAKSVGEAMYLLCEPPVIEIAGPSISTDARRVYVDLLRIRSPEMLELALVDRRNKLQRFPTSTTLSIPALLEAFRLRDRRGIDRFFGALYDHARQRI